MNLRAAGLGTLLVSGLCGQAYAQERRAESTFPFEPWNARAVALGDAGVAAEGAEFTAVNPAAAASERTGALSYRSSPAGLRDYAVEIAHTLSLGSIGLAIRRRDWGEVAADLGLEGLTAGEQSISVTYANHLLSGRVRGGVSVSRLDVDLLGSRSGGWSFDVGAQATVSRGFRVGASFLHLGEDLGGAPLPGRVRGGFSWASRIRPLNLVAAADVAAPTDFASSPDFHFGLTLRSEAGLLDAEARAGWRILADRHGSGSGDSRLTLGGALGVGPVRAGIATASRGPIGRDFVVSLSAFW